MDEDDIEEWYEDQKEKLEEEYNKKLSKLNEEFRKQNLKILKLRLRNLKNKWKNL